MIVKILGGGCAKCNKLQMNTEAALNEMGLEYELKKITDFNEYPKYGVMMTPGLVIDEQLIVSGRVPDIEELKTLLSERVK